MRYLKSSQFCIEEHYFEVVPQFVDSFYRLVTLCLPKMLFLCLVMLLMFC